MWLLKKISLWIKSKTAIKLEKAFFIFPCVLRLNNVIFSSYFYPKFYYFTSMILNCGDVFENFSKSLEIYPQ